MALKEKTKYTNICGVCFLKIEGWYHASGFICDKCCRLNEKEKVELANKKFKEIFGKKHNTKYFFEN